MELGGWAYAAAFAASLLLALFLTPLALRFALKKEVLDHPGDYKRQESPIPYLGGLAIVGSFSIAIILASVLGSPVGGLNELQVVLGLGLLLSLMGLVDDIRGLHPGLRFGIEIAAALGVWYSGIQITFFGNGIASQVVTVLWIVGVTNALNLLDNMDGLSAGAAAIAAGSFFLIAALNGQFLVAGLSIALTGCALGFLRHNFFPAKIYMGDAGSLFLGFVLAVIGVKLRFNGEVQVTFLVPLLVLGVPIFDTLLVVTARLLNKKQPWTGGRDHMSHRLVFVGIPTAIAVSIVYAVGVALGWLALVMTRVDRVTGFILMGLIAVISVFLGVLLGSVPIYERSRRRKMMFVEVARHEEERAS
jgi:UDP-GlcNAc:undecaprenyl-phosphate GlcNAc-1-phosphate transferase